MSTIRFGSAGLAWTNTVKQLAVRLSGDDLQNFKKEFPWAADHGQQDEVVLSFNRNPQGSLDITSRNHTEPLHTDGQVQLIRALLQKLPLIILGLSCHYDYHRAFKKATGVDIF